MAREYFYESHHVVNEPGNGLFSALKRWMRLLDDDWPWLESHR
jgi:hypothetical protein